MLDNQVFTNMMKTLESFYRLSGQVTENKFIEDVYYGVLENCSSEDLNNAVASCIKKNPKQYGFFPSPQQLLEYAKGEYRPPGENVVKANLEIPALASSDSKLTPEQIKELQLRGRLQAKILAYGGRFMSTDEKNVFIDSLRLKPTYELEHMADNAEKSMSNIKDSGKGLEHLSESFKLIKDKLNQSIN